MLPSSRPGRTHPGEALSPVGLSALPARPVVIISRSCPLEAQGSLAPQGPRKSEDFKATEGLRGPGPR